MTPAETAALARSGAIAGLCPTTEANLGDGIFPAVDFMGHGGAIAIGSDSHITVSPAEDLRMLEYSQRLRDRTRNALAGGPGRSTGRSLLRGRTRRAGPAPCASRSAPSPPATASTSRCSTPTTRCWRAAAEDAALDTWIFSGGNALVRDVFVGGQQVVKDRHHIHEDQIARNFRAALRRLDSMIAIGERPLDLSDIRAALAGPIKVELSAGRAARIVRSAETVKRLLATGDAIYGVNTGFGKLAKTRIAAQDLDRLQVNIVRSHAAGVGAPLSPGVTRLILLMKLNALARGPPASRSPPWRRWPRSSMPTCCRSSPARARSAPPAISRRSPT